MRENPFYNPPRAPVNEVLPESDVGGNLERRKHRTLWTTLTLAGLGVAGLGVGVGIEAKGGVQAIVRDLEEPPAMEGPEEAGFPSNRQMIDEMKAGSEYQDPGSIPPEFHRARRETGAASIVPMDFEAAGIQFGLLEKVIDQYPRAWSHGSEVRSLIYRPEDIPMPYAGFEGAYEFAHCLHGDKAPGEIVVTSTDFLSFDVAKQAQAQAHLLQGIVTHEFVHAYSWNNERLFSPQERVQLRWRVFRAVTAKGRPKFWYPEQIQQGEHSARHWVNDRMEEYFPVLVSDALGAQFEKAEQMTWETWKSAFAHRLECEYRATSEEALKNAALVEWYFQRIDRNFQPWIVARELRQIHLEQQRSFVIERLLPIVQLLDDHELRESFMKHLQMKFRFQGEGQVFSEEDEEKAYTRYRNSMKRFLRLIPHLKNEQARVLVGWRSLMFSLRSFSIGNEISVECMQRDLEKFIEIWNTALTVKERQKFRAEFLDQMQEVYRGAVEVAE